MDLSASIVYGVAFGSILPPSCQGSTSPLHPFSDLAHSAGPAPFPWIGVLLTPPLYSTLSTPCPQNATPTAFQQVAFRDQARAFVCHIEHYLQHHKSDTGLLLRLRDHVLQTPPKLFFSWQYG